MSADDYTPRLELMKAAVLEVLQKAGGRMSGAELDAEFPGSEPEMWFAVGALWGSRVALAGPRVWAQTTVSLIPPTEGA